MGQALYDHLAAADLDPNVRSVVLTGAGRGFCAGADMGVLGGHAAENDAEHQGMWPLERSELYPLEIRKPLVAAINGACAGLGLVLALTCDVRFAARGAKFTTSFARRGLVAEHAIAGVLVRAVGHARAVELLLSARIVLAEEAMGLGLVHFLEEPETVLPAAQAYAAELATQCSPTAISAIKRQMRELGPNMDQVLELATALTVASMRWPDFADGVASFLDNRPPNFPSLHD